MPSVSHTTTKIIIKKVKFTNKFFPVYPITFTMITPTPYLHTLSDTSFSTSSLPNKPTLINSPHHPNEPAIPSQPPPRPSTTTTTTTATLNTPRDTLQTTVTTIALEFERSLAARKCAFTRSAYPYKIKPLHARAGTRPCKNTRKHTRIYTPRPVIYVDVFAPTHISAARQRLPLVLVTFPNELPTSPSVGVCVYATAADEDQVVLTLERRKREREGGGREITEFRVNFITADMET